MLINSENLSKQLRDPAWVIFDCRHDLFDLGKGERLYREGHIPGAHFASVDIDLSGDKDGSNGRIRSPLPPPLPRSCPDTVSRIPAPSSPMTRWPVRLAPVVDGTLGWSHQRFAA